MSSRRYNRELKVEQYSTEAFQPFTAADGTKKLATKPSNVKKWIPTSPITQTAAATAIQIPTNKPAPNKSKHSDYCCAGKPRIKNIYNKKNGNEDHIQIEEMRSEFWQDAANRNITGNTNLKEMIDLSSRGPGWYWKASDYPAKQWESVVGELSKPSTEPQISVIWPSKKNAPNKTLRNVENSTGLTIAGNAGEERISSLDKSQGIFNDKLYETIIANKPYTTHTEITIFKPQNTETPVAGPKSMKDLLTLDKSDQWTVKTLPEKICEPKRTYNLCTRQPNNRRYAHTVIPDSKELVQADPSSNFYIDRFDRFSMVPWVEEKKDKMRTGKRFYKDKAVGIKI